MKLFKKFFNPPEPENIGQIHLEWEFPEFEKEHKSLRWYIAMAVIIAALMIYAVYASNYMFLLILILAVFIVVYQFFQIPRQIKVRISAQGIIIDRRVFPFRDIKNFWLIYKPPTAKYLYLEFKVGFDRHYPVPLMDINPLLVRDHLLQYLQEDIDKENEEFNEILSKALKIR
jgi:hypothetical protein